MPPLSSTPVLLGHQVDHRVRGLLVELGRVRAARGRSTLRANSIDRHLQPEADAEERHLAARARSGTAWILPSVPRSPKPPGTRMASTSGRARRGRPPRASCESMYSSCTLDVVGDARRGPAPRAGTCSSRAGRRTCRRRRSAPRRASGALNFSTIRSQLLEARRAAPDVEQLGHLVVERPRRGARAAARRWRRRRRAAMTRRRPRWRRARSSPSSRARSARSQRQSRMSGWMPISRISFTRVLGRLRLQLARGGDERAPA